MTGRDEGATDIVGTLLLVGLTVVLTVALGALVRQNLVPQGSLEADVALKASAGADRAWGTGDENLTITHVGGEPLPLDGLTVQIAVGGTQATLRGTEMSGGDAGRLTVGKSVWTTRNIPAQSEIGATATYVTPEGNSFLLASLQTQAVG